MITIPQSIVKNIKKQGLAEAPLEACGYLMGENGKIVHLRKMTNADKSSTHFSFLPEEQFEALEDARHRNLRLIAVYHTHPETPARMSDEDIRLAYDTETLYFIYSLSDDTLKVFTINTEKRVTEVPLNIAIDRAGTE